MFSLVEARTEYRNIKTVPTIVHFEHDGVVLKLCMDDACAGLMEQNAQT